jgi:hypothetical protein
MLILAASTAGCLITSPPSFLSEAPLTPPRIQDVPGVTKPRLHNIVDLTAQADGRPTVVTFRVPVDDEGVDEALWYQFFVNDDRDCIELEGGVSCEPAARLRTVPASGQRRRFIEASVSLTQLGCNRIELWVTSSEFLQSGNYHTPRREGDVDFATWWVFLRAAPGGVSGGDAGVGDPIERCGQLVQP